MNWICGNNSIRGIQSNTVIKQETAGKEKQIDDVTSSVNGIVRYKLRFVGIIDESNIG